MIYDLSVAGSFIPYENVMGVGLRFIARQWIWLKILLKNYNTWITQDILGISALFYTFLTNRNLESFTWQEGSIPGKLWSLGNHTALLLIAGGTSDQGANMTHQYTKTIRKKLYYAASQHCNRK